LTAGSEREIADALTPDGYSLGRWRSVLNQGSFGTGIYMLSIGEAGKLGLSDLLNDDGKLPDARQIIQRYPEIVKEIRLPGEYLFHHHLDASDGAYVPSLMLSNADPMLLSAHKVMHKYLKPGFLEQKTAYTPQDAVTEFVDSFEENIGLTDPRQRIDARLFQRTVLLTLLYRAAAYRGESGYQWRYEGSLGDEINEIAALLKRPATWGQDWMREPIYKGQTEYGNLVAVLEKDYVAALIQYRNEITKVLTPFERYQGIPKSEADIGTNYRNTRVFLPKLPQPSSRNQPAPN
jgi:hypothetical protein